MLVKRDAENVKATSAHSPLARRTFRRLTPYVSRFTFYDITFPPSTLIAWPVM